MALVSQSERDGSRSEPDRDGRVSRRRCTRDGGLSRTEVSCLESSLVFPSSRGVERLGAPALPPCLPPCLPASLPGCWLLLLLLLLATAQRAPRRRVVREGGGRVACPLPQPLRGGVYIVASQQRQLQRRQVELEELRQAIGWWVALRLRLTTLETLALLLLFRSFFSLSFFSFFCFDYCIINSFFLFPVSFPFVSSLLSLKEVEPFLVDPPPLLLRPLASSSSASPLRISSLLPTPPHPTPPSLHTTRWVCFFFLFCGGNVQLSFFGFFSCLLDRNLFFFVRAG